MTYSHCMLTKNIEVPPTPNSWTVERSDVRNGNGDWRILGNPNTEYNISQLPSGKSAVPAGQEHCLSLEPAEESPWRLRLTDGACSAGPFYRFERFENYGARAS